MILLIVAYQTLCQSSPENFECECAYPKNININDSFIGYNPVIFQYVNSSTGEYCSNLTCQWHITIINNTDTNEYIV